METNIKTIDISAMEWFDKINGNSYFAGTITVNYGLPDAVKLLMPFQYGYGNQYETEAKAVLIDKGFLPDINRRMGSLYTYCNDNNIILRSNKTDRCKKAELKMIDKVYYSKNN